MKIAFFYEKKLIAGPLILTGESAQFLEVYVCGHQKVLMGGVKLAEDAVYLNVSQFL